MIQVKSPDYGMLLSALLGFYLLACTYGAIGAFMSSITTYQVVSAFSTFLAILLLTFIGSVWQQYDFVRDLTFFLNPPGQCRKNAGGTDHHQRCDLLPGSDHDVPAVHCFQTAGAREVKPRYVKAGPLPGCAVRRIDDRLYQLAACTHRLLGYPQQKVNTIHPRTQELVREMEKEPLEVTLYVNFLGRSGSAGLPAARNFYLSWVWGKYTRFKPDIKFRYEYYYDYDSTFMGNHPYRRFPGRHWIRSFKNGRIHRCRCRLWAKSRKRCARRSTCGPKGCAW